MFLIPIGNVKNLHRKTMKSLRNRDNVRLLSNKNTIKIDIQNQATCHSKYLTMI